MMDETPRTNNVGVDEAMERLEQAIERGEDRFPSAEESRAFDQAIRKMLLDLGQRQQRALSGESNQDEEEI